MTKKQEQARELVMMIIGAGEQLCLDEDMHEVVHCWMEQSKENLDLALRKAKDMGATAIADLAVDVTNIFAVHLFLENLKSRRGEIGQMAEEAFIGPNTPKEKI